MVFSKWYCEALTVPNGIGVRPDTHPNALGKVWGSYLFQGSLFHRCVFACKCACWGGKNLGGKIWKIVLAKCNVTKCSYILSLLISSPLTLQLTIATFYVSPLPTSSTIFFHQYFSMPSTFHYRQFLQPSFLPPHAITK